MHFSTYFLVFVGLVLPAVLAQKRCCAPNQYEVRVGSTSISRGRATHGEAVVTKIYMPRLSMDFKNKRWSVSEIVVSDGVMTNISTVVDYRKGFAYVVTHGPTPSCLKVKVPSQMPGPCIPRNAKYLGEITLGSGSGRLVGDTWLVKFVTKNPPSVAYASAVMQRETCAVISEEAEVFAKGTRSTSGVLFFDFHSGIKDTSVFNIPAICKSALDIELSDLSDIARYMVNKYTAE